METLTTALVNLKNRHVDPLALTGFFLFSLVFNSAEKVHLTAPVLAFLAAILLILPIRAGLRFLLKDADKVDLALFLLISVFFTYGRVYEVMPGLQVGDLVIGRNKYMLVGLPALGVLAYAFLRLGPEPLLRKARTFTFLVTWALVLALPLSHLQRLRLKDQQGQANPWTGLGQISSLPPPPPAAASPRLHNIYYIILDSYMEGGALQRHYGYDNAWFLEALKRKGFRVGEGTHSNYPFTLLSMSSTLNMDYIHTGVTPPGQKLGSPEAFKALGASTVLAAMAAKGYAIETRLGWANSLRYSLAYGTSRPLDLVTNEYVMLLVRTSLLRVIEKELLAKPLRAQVLDTFRELGTGRLTDRPYFVYAHILCPHPPYIFNRDGSMPSLLQSTYGRLENTAGYTGQLAYISQATLETVDQILKNDPSDPVIILQGDHGHGYALGDQLLLKTKPSTPFLEAQMGILLATRYPASLPNGSYPGESPVNLFRVLFNDLFASGYPLLPDRHYHTPILEPWQFTEVTADLTPPRPPPPPSPTR